jgi:hypothetical protein
MRMDKKQNQNKNEEFAEEVNFDQNRNREIDLNRHRNREEFAEDLDFNRNQIKHNQEN